MKPTRMLSIFLVSIFLFSVSFVWAARGLEIKNRDDMNHNSGKLGGYLALVIGIDNYRDPKIPPLKTAVNDAKELANLLQSRYGFKVELLLDGEATRKAIIQKLRELALKTTPDESVLIYFAGHGEIDRALNDGWWVPVNAKGGDPTTYVENTTVQKVMRGMKARHVLLISDSCYSGTLFGEGRSLPPLIDDKFYLNLYNEKSRWGMTSGNKTPVSDSGSEGHSIFAYQLIKTLKKNEKPYITTQEVYTTIAPIIANNSEQQPLCSPIRDTGDQGGGFVFVASTASTLTVTDTPSYPSQADQIRQKERQERDRLEAQEEERRLEDERLKLEKEKMLLDKRKALDEQRRKLEAEKARLEAEQQEAAEQRQLDAEQRRLEAERAALAKKTLEEKRRKLEEEKLKLAYVPKTDPAKGSRYIDFLNAQVTDIKFFEGGENTPAKNVRSYRTSFPRTATKYVNWELNLQHPASGVRKDFVIEHIWFNPYGNEIFRHNFNSYIQDNWTSSYHNNGYGWAKTSSTTWIAGTYRVDLYVDGTKIASGNFNIY